MTTDRAAGPERYFYHSFPRRGRSTDAEIEKGCKILSIIRDSGLVMAPEVVKWQYEHEDGSQPRASEVLQRRVCFTELAPHELAEHGKKFGRFALEFDVPVLKSLGAIPVFYIPRALADAKGAEGAASTLVMQLLDAMVLVERIACVQGALDRTGQTKGTFPCTFGFEESGSRTFQLEAGSTKHVLDALTHVITPSSKLLDALRGMTNYFFPADDLEHDDVLGYYREREWRIAGAMTLHGEDLMGSPGPSLIKRLLELDNEFFGKEYPAGKGKNRAEQSFVMPGLGDKPIIRLARRVIAPADALAAVQELLRGVDGAPEAVALESLSA
jgi:hypothetical protein